jgi:hypothetical protein
MRSCSYSFGNIIINVIKELKKRNIKLIKEKTNKAIQFITK